MSAQDSIAARINDVITDLAGARGRARAGDVEAARDQIRQANIKLTALRVAVDGLMGPRTLARGE